MASVFYLAMFMLYTMMVSNNNLHCQAASSDKVDYKCVVSLKKIFDEMIDANGVRVFATARNGSAILNPKAGTLKRCRFVPKTELSGRELVLCKCKVQDRLENKVGGGKESPLLNAFKALDTDKELAKSCGFNDTDCDAAFRSVLTPCEAEVREAMKTCAPMVKAATESDLGNRRGQHCCSMLNRANDYYGPKFESEATCTCSSYTVKYKQNSTNIIRLDEFLHFVNDTLRDECGLSDELYNGPACDVSLDDNYFEFDLDLPTVCLARDLKKMDICGPLMEKSRIQASGSPLIDPFTGCCLNDESCKCDPRSVSCCQKLGKLSKKGRDSCMCQLLNSKTTPGSTIDFLNFVRSNSNQIDSCRKISSVYTDTCVPLPPPFTTPPRKVPVDWSNTRLQRGWNSPGNQQRTLPTTP